MKKSEKISKIDLNAFYDTCLCNMTIELCHDIIYHNNSNYIKKSLEKTRLAQEVHKLLSFNTFEDHPLRAAFNSQCNLTDEKDFEKKFNENFFNIPNIIFYDIKHDDKRASLFFGLTLTSVIGQIKSVDPGVLEKWNITVKTDVGTFLLD